MDQGRTHPINRRLGVPSEYDYWLREYSLNIPQKSITTSGIASVFVTQPTVQDITFLHIPAIPSSDSEPRTPVIGKTANLCVQSTHVSFVSVFCHQKRYFGLTLPNAETTTNLKAIAPKFGLPKQISLSCNIIVKALL